MNRPDRVRALRISLGAATVASTAARLYPVAVRTVVRHNFRLFMAGDADALLRTFADDATLVLDGTHSWSGHHRGKAAIRAFLQRFLDENIRGDLHEVFVAGPPWRTRTAARFTDAAIDASGRIVYENHAMIVGRIRWGKIVHQQVFEDTQRVARFDEYLRRVSSESGTEDPGAQ